MVVSLSLSRMSTDTLQLFCLEMNIIYRRYYHWTQSGCSEQGLRYGEFAAFTGRLLSYFFFSQRTSDIRNPNETKSETSIISCLTITYHNPPKHDHTRT
jgi:hypothetical protein